MSDNIKVVVKVRPLISREIEEKLSYQWRVKNNTLYQLDQNGKDFGQAFTFDQVYDKDTKTKDVYNDIAKPIVEAATAGFNGTIFAYGQTSSGKTYTMTGTDDSPGIIPLAVLNLFEIIKNAPDRDFLLRVSYLEIYNETVKDLLNPEKKDIKIHEKLTGGIKVDVTEEVTSTPEEVLEAMKRGEANRQTGATNMNESSSRSHSIFQITIESREHIEGSEEAGCVNVSQLNLVDLAGSERAGQTGATGLRFKEGTHINKSLSSLALVIKQLSEDNNKFANYRDSKLTRILQNSLGGNAKTSIICAVTPVAVEETISTLQFANRAKAIKNKPEVNAVTTDATMIQSLTKQMSRLQAQLENKKTIEQDNYKLQKQIASLQKLIINGFGQRRNIEVIAGSRRKLQQPRRITISAFHTTERDDDLVAPIPKFCTPSLKYNPNVVPRPSEPLATPLETPGGAGAGGQAAGRLASVPEEPARLVTPPPDDRRVYFNDDVIEIDSDDDSTEGVGEGPCSPYHTCQDASKTPPCVLRKNAKLAEKQMKDILLLTEREKIYKPSEIELIEKLEHSISMKAKLEDEVDILRKQGQEKDLELEQLKNKIMKTEEEVKAVTSANMELQEKCAQYDTKMTDMEVSLETLKRKAKLREEELLSLLEELRVKKVESIGKQLSRTIDKDTPFMDMSKDISLVNSDNENSIVNDEPSEQMCDLVTDTQTQASLKNQTIIELEAKLFSHKQEIVSLEKASQELEDTVNIFKEKLALTENDNSVLKSTIDNLNSTINGQKENLESARSDIESYNSVIQELQIKLTQKETAPNINVNDSVLESMIANEEKFIANNENMKNIIQCLRNVLDNRNKEICQLKSTLQNNNSNDDKTLLEELETKTKQIDNLHLEVNNLKKQVNENIAMINKLMHENNDLKVLEQELTTKLADIEINKTKLDLNNKDNAITIDNLEQENEKLSRELVDNNKNQLELNDVNRDLTKQIVELSNKITDLEKDVKDKVDLISCLSQEDTQSKENIQIAKTAIHKVQAILSVLTGEIQEVPELIDNFVNLFNIFSENLNTLEALATNIVEQKKEAIENNTSLKDTLEKILETHKSEISVLKHQIDELNETKDDYSRDNDMLSQKVHKLKEELERSNHELQNKLTENDALKTELNETIRGTETLRQQFTSLENTIIVLKAKEEELKAALESKQSYFDIELRDHNDAITILSSRLKEIEGTLKDKSHELLVTATKLDDVQKGRDELLTNILKKASNLIDNCNIENYLSCEFEDNDVTIYERILLILDKIANHVTFIDMKNVDCEQENMRDILSEAKREIKHLTERNLKLTNDLFHLGNKNSEITFELEQIQSNDKNLNEHLECSQEILQSVKRELKIKANELASMEDKVKEWKEQFVNLDILMKQQMHELHLENEYLKSQCSSSDLKRDSDLSRVSSEEMDLNDCSHEMKNKIRLSSANKSAEIISPPSLLTICCNKIVDSINSNSDSKTNSSNSDTVIEVNNDDAGMSCRCKHLTVELENSKEENFKIMEALEESQLLNQYLVKEQEDARREIQLLLELQQELQKKLVNHRTNLSILTATTYAENKSLKSQVKVLQHHHNRFHNVCQRDIPDFKKQLRELMALLNGETSTGAAQNISFKRYSLPDVLDSSTAVPNFRNESTLDGDLLMLDTNVTLTTAADNTLLGPDQICLDITQAFYNEACVQTNDTIQICDQNITSQMEILSNDNQVMFEKLQLMRDENLKLREHVDKCLGTKDSMIDAQSSPIKMPPHHLKDSSDCDNIRSMNDCSDCKNRKESNSLLKIEADLKSLSQELLEVKSQKSELEQKYNNLILETPSTEALVRKLNNLEKDHTNKAHEIAKLTKSLDNKNKELKRLQDENDNLSTQVMDNITEADDLSKQLESFKLKNSELTDKCMRLEKSAKELNDDDKSDNLICSECLSKDELIQSMRLKITKTKLNRSFSDSDTSSRYNKICTLQSELHAGREDCKELTEDVVTIKNHLDRSNLSMDLDESMDSNVFTFADDFVPASPQSKKCNMPDIPEERHLDMYMMDKIDCYNYCREKTGLVANNLNTDMKIIEIMKILYENITINHGSEVEHLTNTLREYDDAQKQLKKQIEDAKQEYCKFTKEKQETDKHYLSISSVLSHIKNNINTLNQQMINDSDADSNSKFVSIYKDNFLKLLDKEFGLSSVSIFEFLIENIVNKHQADLAGIMEQYTKMQNHMENVTKELNSVNDNLSQLKCQLSDKEEEYNLLKAQKERIQEISTAVTLDIVKREKELNDTMTKGYHRLLELNILAPNNVDLTLPLNVNINLLFEQLITQSGNRESALLLKEKEGIETELNTLKSNLKDKEQELALIKVNNDKLQEMNNRVTHDLIEKENKILNLKNLHEELNQVYESKVDENKNNIDLIEKITEEVNMLKTTIDNKEKEIESLQGDLNDLKQCKERDDSIIELMETIKDENVHLKALNEMVIKEKEAYASELQKSGETIRQNNIALDKMTSDILVLRESVKDNITVIENLKVEAKTLIKDNVELKEKLEEKCLECSRLETNIKTHEKTAQIQTRIINRLEKQKIEDDNTFIEKNKHLEELAQKCDALQNNIKICKDENEDLRKTKESLETRILDLETALVNHKPRTSMDAIADSSRRRRQSMHDSKRLFSETKHSGDDHSHMDTVFGSRSKPDDLFMDVDDDFSDRSTPIRLSKGHESLSASRTDQSATDEPGGSRPGSVAAARLRRQSSHDLHRAVPRHTPSPHDFHPGILIEELNNLKTTQRTTSHSEDSDVPELNRQLAACRQELGELQEQYRELDEECDTCAQYLRERDAQCARYRKDNTALQLVVTELKEKLQSCSPNESQQVSSQRSVAHAAVNTDEDWANLHAVVVDRMSYDAEVEKNKKLTKTIEELRFTKQDLKNTLAKMQKALEKNSGNVELEATKQELEACKEELQELRERYKELDEECETCAQYLREKEDQCRKLKEAKMALEAKLHEYQGEASSVPLSSRKKRQSAHDQRRGAALHVTHAATETADFLSYQVERDDSTRAQDEQQAKETKRLKMVVEKLSQQKAMLEQQLASAKTAPAPVYVATGSAIVQNQQITDVMKENQKLKKINAKLINICKKRGKDSNRENEDPAIQG